MRINFKVVPFVFLTALLPINAFAEAPVVDDSENYALLEQQQTTPQSSVENNELTFDNYDESAPALAKENKNENLAEDSSNIADKIKGLRQDIQELRGQLEVQAHELKILKEQQLSFYKDLDSRIQAPTNVSKNTNTQALDFDKDPGAQVPIQAYVAKTQPSTPEVTEEDPVVNTSSANTNPADEQISYLAAYELIKNKQFPEALMAMKTFISKYPKGYYSSNAEYWTGELYLADKNYTDAISHFDIVLQQFPSSNKFSACLLKIGYALAGSGRIGEAKERLKEVMKKYPDTRTSELAQLKLKELNR
jgi:tol-pal system protein YbgF